ncbi:PAS domain S-box protein [Sorangium cellulosum]|uniref:hybrid sensor histidine kinase/response regulator n=1 Tax=Sorangium cellulosum TaxID=56 RepID=UPI0013EAF0FC|nr:PAS domain S-box protein [Sorangium cellulosum]
MKSAQDQRKSTDIAAPPRVETPDPGRVCPAPGGPPSDLFSGGELYAALEQAGVALAQGEPPTARILRANREFCELTGYSEAELLERTFFDLTHPEDRAMDQALYEQAARGLKRAWRSEKRYVRKDGEIRWVAVRGAAIWDEHGTPVRTVGIIIDITGLKRAEEALRRSEDRYRCLVEATAETVWITSPDGLTTSESPCWYAMTGQRPEEMLGLGWLESVHPDDRDRTLRRWTHAITTISRYEAEYRVRSADGGYRFTLARAVPVVDRDGRVREWVGMNIDITERKRAEESLREADRRKDEFLAMLAHELRNPLSAMQFALGVSQLSSVPEARRAWALSVMQRQLRQLGRMVDDLLDVSRITRGKIVLKKEPIDLRHVIHQAVAAAGPSIDASKHELSVAVGEGPYWVFGDPARLEQVIVNLLTNAAKYTREGGRIWLTAGREGAEVAIRVRDTGIGIPAEMLPRIFDLFEQAHPTLDPSRGGLGIGLTLVKRLVEMHGGAVSAASEGEGRGSELTVRLPVTEEPARPREQAAPSGRGLARRVLVVDDNRDHAQGLSLLLEQAGHAVALAHDGPSALETARRFAPEVILLDIGLPDLDGYEVARRLREEQGERALRIVALTGYGQHDDRRRSREAGCDAHLVKPVAHEVLLEQIAG